MLDGDDELNIVTTSTMVIDENIKKMVEIDYRLEAIAGSEMEYFPNATYFSSLFQISGK